MMKKSALIIAVLVILNTLLGASVLAENSYNLTDIQSELTTRFVEFTENEGQIIASTSVSNVSGKIVLALILSEYNGATVTNTRVDRKEVTGSGEFTVTMPKKEGYIYKAYVWNYTSLTPYTNVAEYPSADVSIEKLKLGEIVLDPAVKEYTFNALNLDSFPIVTGAPVNNGTKVVVKVSSETLPGTVSIFIYSADGTVTDKIVVNLNDITPELKAWLESMGIDTNVGITTYEINDGDL